MTRMADRCLHSDVAWMDILPTEQGADRVSGTCEDCGDDVVGFIHPVASLADEETAARLRDKAE